MFNKTLHSISAAATSEAQVRKPEFGEVLPNITVAVGRDATLPCVVKHLQDYKVASYLICLAAHSRVATTCLRRPGFDS